MKRLPAGGYLGSNLVLVYGLAALVLVSRNAAYRRIHLAETADADDDGVPDIYRP